MNKLLIIGNLTKDPELRTTATGLNVCTFTVAVNRKKKGEEESDFFRVTVWRDLALNCGRYLAKGRKVAVVGEVGVSTYTTQKGETRASLEVTAQDVEFLTPRDTVAYQETMPQDPPVIDQKSGMEQVDEDLPF